MASGDIFQMVSGAYTKVGNILGPSGLTITGATINPYSIFATGPITTTAGVSGTTGTFSSTLKASGLLTAAAGVSATTGTFTGAVSANSIFFGGNTSQAYWTTTSNQNYLNAGASQTGGGYISNAANTAALISWTNTGNTTIAGTLQATNKNSIQTSQIGLYSSDGNGHSSAWSIYGNAAISCTQVGAGVLCGSLTITFPTGFSFTSNATYSTSITSQAALIGICASKLASGFSIYAYQFGNNVSAGTYYFDWTATGY